MTSTTADRAAYAVVGAVALSVGAVALGAALSDDVRVLDLSRDPATLSAAPAHDGLLTVLSGFAWSATITTLIIGAVLLRRNSLRSEQRLFLLSAAVVSVVLMIDDMFLIHERLAPELGIPERPLFVGYAVGFLVVMVRFRKTVAATWWPVLGLSIGVFGLGLTRGVWWQISDFFLPDTYTFIGAGLWLTYYVHTTLSWIDHPL